MEEQTIIALLSLAFILPSAWLMPVVLYLLQELRRTNRRLNAIEAKLQCPSST